MTPSTLGRKPEVSHTLPFHEAIRARRSVRSFLPFPLSEETINQIAEDARFTPSNCNTQPWQVHIVSGSKRDELSVAMLQAFTEERITKDFSFDVADYYEGNIKRYNAAGEIIYNSLGIARNDQQGRRAITAQNLMFYGGPHAALLFMPAVGDNVRVASDVGMYGQSFLLALAARGLGGIAQTMLGYFSDTVREVLEISDDLKLLFGISFGYPDEQAPSNQIRVGRAALNETVTLHR
jgi:nitroreductase